jgi:steroid 5-alpha reductase family enzyme
MSAGACARHATGRRGRLPPIHSRHEAEYDRDVTSSPWILLGIGAVAASVVMIVLWLVQVRIRDATHVDVGWAYGVGALAVLDAAIGDGSASHRLLVGALGGLWSIRLGTYLVLNRLVGTQEDGRYRELRRRWAPHANRSFFVFFQAQAAFVVIFSLPFAFVSVDNGRISPLVWAGCALAVVAIGGEVLADRQLAVWRADPAHRGQTCRAGLWSTSRHPNYFFEWLHWVGWAVIALGSPTGWVALFVPIFLLALLFRVTGIPETEAQALRTRGDDYRRYQQEVSVFVPWLPRRPSQMALAGAGRDDVGRDG